MVLAEAIALQGFSIFWKCGIQSLIVRVDSVLVYVSVLIEG